jgi:antitoxin component YwqK of YwqJK toxin-antitoxin module
MKNKKYIIGLTLGIIIVLISILFPRHCKSNASVNYREGGLLTLEGKAIVIPFLAKIRIGTWEAKYDNGQVGEILEYKWGKAFGSYKRYYSNGAVSVIGEYKNGLPYGKWSIYRKDGSKRHFAIHSGDKKKPPKEEIFYGINEEVIQHYKNGNLFIDNKEEYFKKAQNNFDALNSDTAAAESE